MNQKGRDKLREAALSGIRQVKGYFRDSGGGYCGLGVLGLNKTGNGISLLKTYDLQADEQTCTICGKKLFGEASLMIHYNDMHDVDFLGLAEKMPMSPESE